MAPMGSPLPRALARVMISGVDAEMLIGKQFAGPPHTGLDLIKNQQHAGSSQSCLGPLSDSPGPGSEPRLRPESAPASPRRYLASMALLKGFDIVEGNKIKPSQHRVEPFPDLFLAGGRQGGHGPAVK